MQQKIVSSQQKRKTSISRSPLQRLMANGEGHYASTRRVFGSSNLENAPHPDLGPDIRRATSLQSLPTKPGLGEGNTKLKTLQETRRVLSDRSNVKRHTPLGKSAENATTAKEKLENKPVETLHDSTTISKDAPAVSIAPPLSSLSRRSDFSKRVLRDVTRDINNNNKTVSENDLDTKQVIAKEDEDELVKDFYEDNKTRYQEKEEKALPVPVLPIKVPDHMKQLFVSRQLTAKAQARRRSSLPVPGIKRKLEGTQELVASGERKKPEQGAIQEETGALNMKEPHDPAPRDHIDKFFDDKSADPTTIGEKIEESAAAAYKLEPVTPILKGRVFERLDSIPDITALRADLLSEDVYKAALAFDKQQELRAAQVKAQATRNLTIFDYNDPMMVAEYADDIFTYLHEAEVTTLADPLYATNQQHEITWKTRGVLIDWVIEVHYRFGLLPETLFLAVNIIDRFLSRRTVALGKLQLVGITSLFIATKFEEMLAPPLSEFLCMTNQFVNEDEMLKAERFILQVLDFRLCFANPLNFFRRAAMAEDYDLHTRMLAKYFMEISCVDHRFIGIRPSQISSASLWLAQKMITKKEWHSRTVHFTGYKIEDLKPTVELMLDYLSQPVKHDIFYHKWATRKLLRASIFVRDWINRYYIE